MRRIIFVLFLMASVSGCIKLQMPDDMVSDTVEAGRDIYDDVTDSDEDGPASGGTASGSIFSHTVVGASDSPESDLRETCLSELESRAKELLGTEEITFTLVSETISTKDEKAIVSCTISVE